MEARRSVFMRGNRVEVKREYTPLCTPDSEWPATPPNGKLTAPILGFRMELQIATGKGGAGQAVVGESSAGKLSRSAEHDLFMPRKVPTQTRLSSQYVNDRG